MVEFADFPPQFCVLFFEVLPQAFHTVLVEFSVIALYYFLEFCCLFNDGIAFSLELFVRPDVADFYQFFKGFGVFLSEQAIIK